MQPLVTLPGSPAALMSWQNGPGGLLAVACDQQLSFYNRHGHQIDKMPLSGYASQVKLNIILPFL